MCPRAVPGGAVPGICTWQREPYAFSMLFASAVLQILRRSCLGRCLSASRRKCHRTLMVKQDGRLVPQCPGLLCGSVPVP